jgi:hypothetical protein
MQRALFIAAVAVCFCHSAFALTPADRCEADKLKRAGKYNFCRMKAESKAVKRGTAPDYTLCDAKLSQHWTQAESIAGGMCPTNGDLAEISVRIAGQTDDIVTCLNGSCLPICGDGMVTGSESCDGVDLDGQSCASQGFGLGGTLTCTPGCSFDFSGCQAQAFPASGQTTSYGPGSDGDVQAGAALTFVDNGDGTVTDANTGLMWEKKSDDGSVHDWDDTYAWGSASVPYLMNGPMVTVFLDTLNDVAGGGANCFAGHCDWRMPNRRELESIIDFENVNPAVPGVFNSTCAPGCSVTTCSCITLTNSYWTSTTYSQLPAAAWVVNFSVGNIFADIKSSDYYVRAVR